MLKLRERAGDETAQTRAMLDAVARSMYFALPCIVVSVDYARQTLVAQPAIRENLILDGVKTPVEIPELPDVPFFVYSGGGYCITTPIKAGNDCLVVFADMCIDAWWQSGGTQNQVERRRHDLSDGFAIVGFRSQPQVVGGYSSDALQMRNAAGDACIEISGNTINISAAGGVNINGSTIKLNS